MPTLMARSGVITPLARPRIPSVPKYFRPISSFPLQLVAVCQSQSLHHLQILFAFVTAFICRSEWLPFRQLQLDAAVAAARVIRISRVDRLELAEACGDEALGGDA